MAGKKDEAAQGKAMELISAGAGLREAAEGAGVSRMTLHRWMREDPAFVAAWNAWRAHARRAAASRLLGIADRAVQVVGEAIDGGDAKLALAVVKGMGLMADPQAGSEDAKIVEREMKGAREREERTVVEAEVMEEMWLFRGKGSGEA